MSLIRLLPDALANQIAAGEVVQRPASVVKELLENSVDAQSENIQLVVREAGKTLIQVIDDGQGMNQVDARMCFERHATSKIKKIDDLFNLRTFGFRGEAMASIAAVAQVEMRTKTQDEDLGTLIQIEGSKIVAQQSVACAKGTNIQVKNLFFNIPARRNFLKTDSVELRHIIDEFYRVALANPHINFSFYQNDLEVHKLRKGKLAQRIVGIFGKNYQERLIACSEETSMFRLQGYVGKPEFAKKTRGEQFFFVNNRFIRHNYLHHAVMEAYEGLLLEDSFPLYVLFIDTDPKSIDVNVHPTKTEVKFEDERTLYALINAAVRQSLGTHHVKEAIDFSYDVNFTQSLQKFKEVPIEIEEQNRRQANLENWTSLYEDMPIEVPKKTQEIYKPNQAIAIETVPSRAFTLESAANLIEHQEKIEHKRQAVFQVLQSFVLSTMKSGLLLIDQQAASERIFYERFLSRLNQSSGSSQQLLFPQKLSFSSTDFTLFADLEKEIRASGFDYEIAEKNTILIKGVPTELKDIENLAVLFEQLLEKYKNSSQAKHLIRRESVSLALAKFSAIRKGRLLNSDEMFGLIDQLFACQQPNYTCEGQKTFVLLNEQAINHLFVELT